MRQDLAAVYEAATLMEAQLLVSRLEEAGIEAFVDQTDSPLDGLTAAYQTKIVRVLPENQAQAQAIAQEFQRESSKQ